jgi:hypothetical protein
MRPSAHLLRRAAMIVALHVATGAAAGAASGSRLAALLLGPVLHLAGDRLPHQDIRSRRFEIGSGFSRACSSSLGGAARSILRRLAPRGAPHLTSSTSSRSCARAEGSSSTAAAAGTARGRFSADLQLLLAGAILGALIAPRGSAFEREIAERRSPKRTRTPDD